MHDDVVGYQSILFDYVMNPASRAAFCSVLFYYWTV